MTNTRRGETKHGQLFAIRDALLDGAEKWPKQKESDFLLLGKQGEKGSNCCDYTTMLPFERNPPPPSQLEDELAKTERWRNPFRGQTLSLSYAESQVKCLCYLCDDIFLIG